MKKGKCRDLVDDVGPFAQRSRFSKALRGKAGSNHTDTNGRQSLGKIRRPRITQITGVWGAHAARVLVSAARRNNLFTEGN
jgi:hypothetical protein